MKLALRLDCLDQLPSKHGCARLRPLVRDLVLLLSVWNECNGDALANMSRNVEP